MATRAGESRAVVKGSPHVGESGWMRFLLGHTGWPGWTFALTFSNVPALVGFEIYGDGAAAGAERLVDLRTRAGTLVPASDAPTVTARLMREVPFRDLEHAARSWMRRARGISSSPAAKAYLARVTIDRPQRSRWSQAELAGLCAEYVSLLEAEEPDPAPIRTLHTRRGLSESRIRNLLAEARGDLLTHPPAGRAGGELTDKAKEILSGDHQAP